MGENNITFNDRKINNSTFYRKKDYLIVMTLMLIKYEFLKKNPLEKEVYLNASSGHDDNDYMGPLCIMLPQMIGYVKCFDDNKTT